MYVKVIDGSPKKYSLKELKRDNPTVSFPKQPDNNLLEKYDVYPLKNTPKPNDYDELRQKVEEITPELVNGEWSIKWEIQDLDPAVVNSRIMKARKKEYEKRSDPLFFEFQYEEDESKKENLFRQWKKEVSYIKIEIPKN